MLSGCGSKARTRRYRFDASYAIFASVLPPFLEYSYRRSGAPHFVVVPSVDDRRRVSAESNSACVGRRWNRVGSGGISVGADGNLLGCLKIQCKREKSGHVHKVTSEEGLIRSSCLLDTISPQRVRRFQRRNAEISALC